jgi:hypothetical protein
LPQNLDGKEGVDGSSPSEGSAKGAEIAAFLCRRNLHELQYAGDMEPFMELSDPERPLGARDGGAQADLDEAACVDAGLSSAPDQS